MQIVEYGDIIHLNFENANIPDDVSVGIYMHIKDPRLTLNAFEIVYSDGKRCKAGVKLKKKENIAHFPAEIQGGSLVEFKILTVSVKYCESKDFYEVDKVYSQSASHFAKF